jgi:hypothetical protein
MRWQRLLLAGVLLVLALVAVLLASDLRSWRSSVEAGDTRYAQSPATARWATTTILPGDPALHILGLQDQLAFRRAMKSFLKVVAAGNGIDNGYTESAKRGALESDLTNLAQTSYRRQASEAQNLVGILTFLDSQLHGPSAPAPVERSVSAFQAAVTADPSYEDAKFNLELLLRELLAKGVRPGSNSSSGGPAKGHHGAAGGVPGRGY